MRSGANGCLRVQAPAKGGGFGTNYVLTRVCNVSGLEKPQTQVRKRVSKVEVKRAPFKAFNLLHIHRPDLLWYISMVGIHTLSFTQGPEPPET